MSEQPASSTISGASGGGWGHLLFFFFYFETSSQCIPRDDFGNKAINDNFNISCSEEKKMGEREGKDDRHSLIYKG